MAKKAGNGVAEASAVLGGEPADVAAAGAAPLDPEVAAKIASLRSHVRESFGKVVMAMMMLPRYRHQTLGDLQHLLLEPLIRDRVAIAERVDGEGLAGDMAGVAIWASLSDEADARVREQIRSRIWPLRLKADDWNSGPHNWLIDVIAPDQRSTANVIANIRQVVKEGSLSLHPLIARLIDAESLHNLGIRRGPGESGPVSAAAGTETVN